MRASRPRSNHSRAQARGSWLSLFAMLMIFIGPLISQAMPMDHHAMSMTMNMAMPMDMPGHDTAQAGQDAGEHQQNGAEHHALWEKCGYCSLLFSCPALPQSLSFAALDGPRPTSLPIPLPRLGHARQTTFPGARSRAPPTVLQARTNLSPGQPAL
ncbi:DUF2946 domain-containing protein [Pseudomonas gingeri]|uniref:DUF2946 domain-containing protein n=1 Tax=Pseudomonas gingeri TaxID=117681 RepID=UPI00159FDDD6|nr:DUF2946 domain-containing protein [Pseudomonas gingeri]NWD09179.1 DUF2946 domain-containing protein [Pseudomonas gingeri]NWE34978.1 DUF2946 domain-containing protein [Pseudomonas gingeri]NWE60782.1 DUF2946 domain-containing protein [Pseudomonas gingeri]NWF01139.1 DUF2946 domain-containing protein [Pseudomonas gingeri]